MLSCSVILVNYRNADLCLDVVARSKAIVGGAQVEWILVDNDSGDGSEQVLRKGLGSEENVQIFQSGANKGFGFGCNFGASVASSDVLWFLNSDAWVHRAAERDLTELFAFLRQAGVGAVATAVSNSNGVATPQAGGDLSFSFLLLSSFRLGAVVRAIVGFGLARSLMHYVAQRSSLLRRYLESLNHTEARKIQPCVAVGGASFLVLRERFQKVGGFDEGFFLYDEDGDLCLRLNAAGLQNFLCSGVEVRTVGSASTSKLPSLRLKRIKRASRLRLIRKHFSGPKKLLLVSVTWLTWYLL